MLPDVSFLVDQVKDLVGRVFVHPSDGSLVKCTTGAIRLYFSKYEIKIAISKDISTSIHIYSRHRVITLKEALEIVHTDPWFVSAIRVSLILEKTATSSPEDVGPFTSLIRQALEPVDLFIRPHQEIQFINFKVYERGLLFGPALPVEAVGNQPLLPDVKEMLGKVSGLLGKQILNGSSRLIVCIVKMVVEFANCSMTFERGKGWSHLTISGGDNRRPEFDYALSVVNAHKRHISDIRFVIEFHPVWYSEIDSTSEFMETVTDLNPKSNMTDDFEDARTMIIGSPFYKDYFDC